MKKFFTIIFFIICGAIPSLGIIHCLKLSSVKFIGSEFLLGYLGVFLGFAFSIVTFIMSLVDKARTKVDSNPSYTQEEKVETQRRISALLEEVSDNMKFLFFSFLFVVFIMILEIWDVPDLSLPATVWYNKFSLLNAVKFSIFGLSVYVIYDLLIGTFGLNKRVEDMLRR
ncbi:hypothetical protein [Fibrella forsythiae]|uniref:Uncharacterized protein n=1 Tax=Fibrella forsythiae TaxID=2817061 RepID=A0ABS3JP54_9BACT|nr:hypothetical protein [Fibrella forsythiae]MBO0950702.1 hypothetical protein [Fibrella forsythiae]